MRGRDLFVLLAVSGCTAGPSTGEFETASTCFGASASALSAVDRKLVGAATSYEADGTLRGRDAELASSQRVRREVAWQVVAKVLAPVPLSEELSAGVPAELPTWQTWHQHDDLRRMFQRLYGALSEPEKRGRQAFDAATLDEAFAWNVRAVDELPTWSSERYEDYIDAIDDAAKVAGVGGISRVSYSPAAARHLLASYPEVLRCRTEGAPPERAIGAAVDTPVARTAVATSACEAQVVGTHAITEDETLVARVETEDDATLVLRTSTRPDAPCTADAGKTCEVSGPAIVDVAVVAGDTPVLGVVDVTRRSQRPSWAACLSDAFPLGSVVVKADYRRADFGMSLDTYDTSAAALSLRADGERSWDVADGEADPGPADIYSLTLPGGARYRLAALHIMTKELDHWLWTTLWWAPEPTTDFGADRPVSLAQSGSPWRHYKMCAASAFDEGDALPGGGFEESHPTLASALAATHGGVGSPSWCSNPYLERGASNATTNCIGCHQHGGTHLLSEDILRLDHEGRTALRNNFPADYAWATTRGDNLGETFAETELYHLGAP